MKKTKLFFTAMMLLLTAGIASAQMHEVTGFVIDKSTGESISFASVMVKGTMTGVSTDELGRYTISASDDAVLVFSFVGYESLELQVSGKKTIDAELSPSTSYLEDAIVVGYGSAKKVGTLVGSVTTVKSDVLKNAPSSSALDQLQGQVAGLSVMTTGGVAGDNNVSMTLHGVGSLGSSSTPLYIIDGMPSNSRSIQSMNPNDIQSVSVLKDASATSIYGSRAANGVVFITTKAGAYNERATITIRSQAGVSTLADKTLYNNMMSGDELKEFWVLSGIHTPEFIQKNYTDKGYVHNTKWHEYFQNMVTPQIQNDISIEGGGKKVAYMVGASQFHQKGTSVGNFYDRYTLRTNVQAHPTDWLKVGANVNVTADYNQTNGNWGDSSNMSPYTAGGLSYLQNPLYPALDENGKEYEVMYPSGSLNPQYWVDKNPDKYSRYGLIANVNVEITPFKNFTIASRAGVDGYFRDRTAMTYPSYVNSGGSGTKIRQNYFEYTATITNTLEYKFDINKHHEFAILAGHEGISNYYNAFAAVSSGQTDDRLMELEKGSQAKFKVSESMTQSKFLSFFGHLDYTLFGRYILDATVRNDASSRFGKNHRNAIFWSVGGLWKIKKESFMRDVNWVDDLNFKVSYGTQGNASIGNYAHLGIIGSTTNYADKGSVILGQPANPGLTWEKQALLTVALSGRLFNTLDLAVEFYNRQTSSMLMKVPFPYTTGFKEVTSNVGGLRNTGVDITLGVDILKHRDYYFRVNATLNYNDEIITELFDGRKEWTIANTGITYVVGQPVSFYAPIYAGVDPADGQMMWYLPGDDYTKTTKKETTKVYDEDGLTQNTGFKRNPPINGGFGISAGWKGISLAADFSFVLGKTLINNDAYFYANPNNAGEMNQIKDVMDFWTPTNTDAKYPDWTSGALMEFDTHMYENADFLRLKNLQIAYTFPKKILKNQDVLKGFKVSFTGRNLLTATKYSGIDPEVNSNLTYGIPGNSKQFLFGVEFTF